ncbi:MULTISPECIES: hypothetical protein [Citrobacter]|uniref:hypothetical protein n=1 Tax=Citrobacter TaxID=544 RepID=UPI0015EA2EB5|nr:MULTISPECIES: hypothetical protein [Citrobacter]MDW2597481.1 hypothetical protein [Citrobacter braakii]MDW2661288.1 hypothetical protein [Citrobacter braakii]MDW2709010.1 hypothetical protein [Citrobacter braakii]QLW40888.1 hypothetical protein HV229_10660 [Citrobacter sp. RHBSTW-00524]HEF0009692.1 hypothetical protein [Citrobacter braakii]
MKRFPLIALILMATSASAHQLESQFPHGLDEALRCAYFADKAELSTSPYEKVALRIAKEAYRELSDDAFTIKFAEDFALAATGAYSQVNMFANRQQGTVDEMLRKGAIELMKVNQCEKVK